jgi:hypothetical protein
MFGPFFVGFGLLWVGALVLWIWALVDCIQVPDDSMYESGTKLIWVLVIVFASFIGAILYFVLGRPRPGSTPSVPRGSGSLPPPPPPS